MPKLSISERLVRLPWNAEMRGNGSRMPYNTARWQKLREGQLRAEPLCRFCMGRDVHVLATVCDHITPHRGDLESFWAGPFQSLCKPCHDGDKQRIERGGKPKPSIGLSGWAE
jgi:5-methylcytosine-specific restriction endonuclease McrA